MVRSITIHSLMMLTVFGLVVGGEGVSTSAVVAAETAYPLGAAVAADGNLYIVDRKLAGVWKVADGKLTELFKASKMFRTPLNAARCITADPKGGLFVGDTGMREVYHLGDDGKPVPLTDGGIGIPMGIAVDGEGNLFVSDLELHRIWKVPGGKGKPEEFAVVEAPRGLTIDAEGRLLIVSGTADQLIRVTMDKKVEVVVKGRPFSFPHDVVLDKQGVAYVSDGYNKAIWKVTPDGKTEKWVSGEPFDNPVGLEWQGENLLVVDSRANKVFRVDPAGKVEALTFE